MNVRKQVTNIRPDNAAPVKYRPGVALPGLGYFGSMGSFVAAMVVAVIAGYPHSRGWLALQNRLIGGEVCALFAWFFYKLGSSAVILEEHRMRILTWGLRWEVGRDEIEDAKLMSSGLVIELADGCKIQPLMFAGGILLNTGGRYFVRDRIREWRYDPTPVPKAEARWLGLLQCRRHWRVRGNWLMLAGMVTLIASEAVVVTAFT